MAKKYWTDEKWIEASHVMREMLLKGHNMNECFRALNIQQAMFYTWKKANPEHFIDFPKPKNYGNGKLKNAQRWAI